MTGNPTTKLPRLTTRIPHMVTILYTPLGNKDLPGRGAGAASGEKVMHRPPAGKVWIMLGRR